jgi:hypothetical protein
LNGPKFSNFRTLAPLAANMHTGSPIRLAPPKI